MNIYDYRTIPPEESAYHARTTHGDEYGDDDIPREDMSNLAEDEDDPADPDSGDFGVHQTPGKVLPGNGPKSDGPGVN